MILNAIKQQTQENHTRLEQTSLMQPVTSPELTMEQYTRVLRVFYGFFQPVEDQINKFSVIREFLPDFDMRRKAAMIKKDLLCLDAIQAQENPAFCRQLPPLQTPAQAFGALYVMEGSTLGGKFIARNVEKTLNLHNTCGVSFFYGYKEETGSRWKSFQQALVSFSEQSEEDQEIIQSANHTFQAFEDWINQH